MRGSSRLVWRCRRPALRRNVEESTGRVGSRAGTPPRPPAVNMPRSASSCARSSRSCTECIRGSVTCGAEDGGGGLSHQTRNQTPTSTTGRSPLSLHLVHHLLCCVLDAVDHILRLVHHILRLVHHILSHVPHALPQPLLRRARGQQGEQGVGGVPAAAGTAALANPERRRCLEPPAAPPALLQGLPRLQAFLPCAGPPLRPGLGTPGGAWRPGPVAGSVAACCEGCRRGKGQSLEGPAVLRWQQQPTERTVRSLLPALLPSCMCQLNDCIWRTAGNSRA